MSNGQPCGRPIYAAPAGVDTDPLCLMHSRDKNKDTELFQHYIRCIYQNTSDEDSTTECFDFGRFVFPEALFTGWTFRKPVDFSDAEFATTPDFREAKFVGDAKFERAHFERGANFHGAVFEQKAVFREATFNGDANFRHATFDEFTDFTRVDVTGVLNFSGLRIPREGHVLLHGINRIREKKSPPELRLRLWNTLVECIRFEDVRWHRRGGRLVLQDELDVKDMRSGKQEENEKLHPVPHEVVADAYRRLVNNFEKNRQYELAEECVIGEWEMGRINPHKYPLLARKRNQSVHHFHGWLPRWLSEHLSFTYLYRLLSLYGASYRRALAWLAVLLLAFAVIFPIFGLRPAKGSDLKPQCPTAAPSSPEASHISWRCALAHENVSAEFWGTFKTGLWASVEAATFQRDKLVEPANGYGRALAILESIAVPGQAALFFLALRRRFRR